MATNDTWQSGDAYERYMGRWSRQLATLFLNTLGAPPAQRWLDVGCGTGALCEAILAQCAPRSVVGVDPSEGFLATAKVRLGERVGWHRAPASEIPLADGAVDLTVSNLVLNFVPDAHAALREMARVTAEGGRVGACVWDYGGRMDLIRLYWEAAAQVAPAAAAQDQGERFPLCRPEALATAFADAGLRQVVVSAIELPMRFKGFDDYWQPFLGGQGPAPAHAMGLSETQRAGVRERLRHLLQERLAPQADGTLLLAARAWAAQGVVAVVAR